MPAPLVSALGMVKRARPRASTAIWASSSRAWPMPSCAPPRRSPTASSTEHFPLVVWQTGSGTQSNMNANEVIANRANELLGGARSAANPRSIPTTTSTAASPRTTPSRPRCTSPPSQQVHQQLLPALEHLLAGLQAKAAAFKDIVKIGRTHLQDATPLTLGQEFSGYVQQVAYGIARVRQTLPRVSQLAQGGTAVGTGLNAPPGFAEGSQTRSRRSPACRSRAPTTSSRRWPRTTRWSSCRGP